jgi:hypothetical protein
MRRIPFVGRLLPAAGEGQPPAKADPENYTVQEVCVSIEKMIESMISARKKHVGWQRHNILSLHDQDDFSAPLINRLTQHYLALPPYTSSVSSSLLATIQCIAAIAYPARLVSSRHADEMVVVTLSGYPALFLGTFASTLCRR